jgi:hypothetical protein
MVAAVVLSIIPVLYIAIVFLRTTGKALQCPTATKHVKQSKDAGEIKFNIKISRKD